MVTSRCISGLHLKCYLISLLPIIPIIQDGCQPTYLICLSFLGRYDLLLKLASLPLDKPLQHSMAFGAIWVPKKKNIIKDAKRSGDIVGITCQKSALVRWALTRHCLASFSGAMEERAGLVRNCKFAQRNEINSIKTR